MLFELLTEQELSLVASKANLVDRMQNVLTASKTIIYNEPTVSMLVQISSKITDLLSEAAEFKYLTNDLITKYPALDITTKNDLEKMACEISTIAQTLSNETQELSQTALRASKNTFKPGIFTHPLSPVSVVTHINNNLR